MKWFRNLLKRFRKAEPHTEVLPSQLVNAGGDNVLYSPKATRSNLPFSQFIPYLATLVLAAMAADIAAIYTRSYLIPTTAPNLAKKQDQPVPFRQKGEFDVILTRNIFNSDGIIPLVGGGSEQNSDGPVETNLSQARESSLPLTLVGTIVHADPGKSVATIEPKGSPDKVLPYVPNDTIEGLAELVKVIRKKVYIRNLQSKGLEYLQIKDDPTFKFTSKTVAIQDGPVSREGDSNFSMVRSDLDSMLSNLPDLLTKARAIPNTLPDGSVDGWKITEIEQGSIYEKLGIKDGDVIKGVNGEKVDSPAKAMELFNALRTQSSIRLTLDRGGRITQQNYSIK